MWAHLPLFAGVTFDLDPCDLWPWPLRHFLKYEFLSSNFGLVTDRQTDRQAVSQCANRQTDRQTDSRRHLRAHHPLAQVGSKTRGRSTFFNGKVPGDRQDWYVFIKTFKKLQCPKNRDFGTFHTPSPFTINLPGGTADLCYQISLQSSQSFLNYPLCSCCRQCYSMTFHTYMLLSCLKFLILSWN